MKIMRIFSYIVILVLLLIGISFAALNATPVTLNYYFNTLDVSLSLLLVFSLGIGIILGFFASIPSLYSLKRENSSLKKSIKKATQDPSKKKTEGMN